MTTNTEVLEAKEQKARAAYEQAQTAANEARQREAEHQAERAQQVDLEVLAGYSEADHAQAIADAKQELVRAIADSAIGRAWVNYQAAQLRQAHAAGDASGAASRLGREPVASRPANNTDPLLLAQLVDQIAGNLIAAELDQRDEEREARIQAKVVTHP